MKYEFSRSQPAINVTALKKSSDLSCIELFCNTRHHFRRVLCAYKQNNCVSWELGRLFFELLRILFWKRRINMKFKHVYCKMFIYKVQIPTLQIAAWTTVTHKTLQIVLTPPHSALQNSSGVRVFPSSVFRFSSDVSLNSSLCSTLNMAACRYKDLAR
jgi:hypothetical protein